MSENKSCKTEKLEMPKQEEALPPASRRALSEADARKSDSKAKAEKSAKEIGGRKEGNDPTRYGDWEFKGRAIDF